jgi:hypothetical protein
VHDHVPHDLLVRVRLLGLGTDLHEDPQQVNRRNRDDGRRHLELQRPRVELAQPAQRIRALGVDGRDEILVTREHHHDDEAAHQHDIDHGKHGEYEIGFRHLDQVAEDVPGLLEKLEAERDQRQRQPQENRREDPARSKQRLLRDFFQLGSHVTAPKV